MGSWVRELEGRRALHLSDEWYRIYARKRAFSGIVGYSFRTTGPETACVAKPVLGSACRLPTLTLGSFRRRFAVTLLSR
jgi:hypothetical protein